MISPALPASSPTPTASPAMGRFRPMALSALALAMLSIGLMAWSHQGWHALQQRAHAFDTLLSSTQLQARQSQWLTEQQALDQAGTHVKAINALALQAQSSAQQLQHLAPASLQPELKRLADLVLSARHVQEGRLMHPPTTEAAQLHALLNGIDLTARTVATEWAVVVDEATRHQQRLDQFNMGLVGGITVLLLTLMVRAQRQRGAAMDALKAREAQLRAFADTLPDLAVRMDASGRYLDIYGTNISLLKRAPEDMIGRALSDVFLPDMVERFMETLHQALACRQAQSITFSLTIRREKHYFDGRCAPIGDSNEVVWMVWDVSARREAERQLRHKTRMYDFLRHVNQAIVRAESEADLLSRVCEVAVEHGQFRKAWVALFEAPGATHLRCQALAGDPQPALDTLSFALLPTARPDATLDRSLREGHTFRTSDLHQFPALPLWARQAVQAGTPGCVVLPLRRDQALVGHLILLGRRVKDQDAEELALFEDLSHDLSLALTNLYRDGLHDLAQERVRLHAAALESTRDGMMVLSRKREVVSINPAFTALTGYTEDEAVGRTPNFLMPDHPEDTIAEIRRDLMNHGAWQGEVWFRRKSGDLFMVKMSLSAVQSSCGRPAHFVGMFTDITPLKQTEERLARMAHFDPLTDLPNRVMIHQRLSHALSLAQRHRTLVGVVFIDLDNFKTVNDGLGHAAGDNLLKLVAERLRQRVRQEDTLGRLSGDEFILVLEHLRHPQQAAQVATAILDTLGQPFTLEGGQQVYVRASIGISLFPDDGQDASELIRNADAAMYESKRRGRNSFNFYTEAFTAVASTRLQMETRLRRAVEHGEFVLHYQPMMNLAERRIVALEALVRLKAPTGADAALPSIGPTEFIPVMEETGMIVALSEWVLQEACRQGKAWLDAGLHFGRIAVNLSPSEISRGGVIERISRILASTGLPPEHLEIEITESGLMESGLGAEQFLQMLHQLGVALSIDDFGTGYSSLAYLKRFPVHQLKIDRSFVQDIPGNDSDCQLVSTMISMAHGLKMHVVAEGVELPDQEAFLASQGCDVVQGYLYSRPVPAEQMLALLENAQPRRS